MITPILVLSSKTTPCSDPEEFDLWVAFVDENLKEAVGFEVQTDQFKFGTELADRVERGTEEQITAILKALEHLHEAYFFGVFVATESSLEQDRQQLEQDAKALWGDQQRVCADWQRVADDWRKALQDYVKRGLPK